MLNRLKKFAIAAGVAALGLLGVANAQVTTPGGVAVTTVESYGIVVNPSGLFTASAGTYWLYIGGTIGAMFLFFGAKGGLNWMIRTWRNLVGAR